MLSACTTRWFGRKLEDIPAAVAASASQALANALPQSLDEPEESTLLASLGWITAALGAVALGLFVGRELRQRYKFNRRTPYDFYSHSGDLRREADLQDMEFGVGI